MTHLSWQDFVALVVAVGAVVYLVRRRRPRKAAPPELVSLGRGPKRSKPRGQLHG